ncbi:hypothetical protein QBC34DRAFT_334564 [Podospora aff. communis PSN243]|uniref:Dihydrodipicolinate synthase n=1 Tax=Podospora aff. communis PSN243 TaxID=3040156 RepID=A0AAV9G950_9PEZI|nr:hypothetical protein QBC34DRAFT_334564 [Podospora aff. communis PSN243]
MTTPPILPPPAGIWCPAITLFHPATSALDLPSQAKYYAHLSRSGLTGLLILGTNAEPLLLSRTERRSLLQLAKESCPPGFPLMAGISGHSTAQVLEYLDDAVECGYQWVLVLPPGYFPGLTTGRVVDEFFGDVATKAGEKGVGTVVYNFPGVCNGVDLSSEDVVRLARGNGGVVGVKLTCGSVAKMVRIVGELEGEKGFATFGGQSDFLIGGLSVGGSGCIAAFANVIPRTAVKIWELWGEGRREEALKLHRVAALAEGFVKQGGVAAVKYAAGWMQVGRAGVEEVEGKVRMRRPYGDLPEERKKAIREGLREVKEIEDALWAASR